MSTHGCNQHKRMADPLEHFWSQVDKSAECWLWLGVVSSFGYGISWYHRAAQTGIKTQFAHRVAWHLVNGPIPAGKQAHHTCGNKLCVNPAHLRLMTLSEHRLHHISLKTHCKRGHPREGNVNARGVCRLCERMKHRRLRAKRKAAELLAAVTGILLVFTGPAIADVRVSLAPDDTPVTVSTPTGYTATITADSPTLVHDAVIMIPGHGAPCGQPDELGEPYGADATSNFVVLTSGVLVSGRFVTFPGEWTVTPEAPLTFHLDVLAPPLAACFYAGSTISSDAPVTGLAQGAEMDVQQSSAFATSGSWLQVASRRYQLAWRATSTDQGHRVAKWRLGLPAGFSLVSSTLGAAKQRLSPSSLSLVWSTPRPLDDAETVIVDAPCGIGTIHARLRLERDDGLITGTGNTGPGLDLPPC